MRYQFSVTFVREGGASMQYTIDAHTDLDSLRLGIDVNIGCARPVRTRDKISDERYSIHITDRTNRTGDAQDKSCASKCSSPMLLLSSLENNSI
jgi:hypothetical protein